MSISYFHERDLGQLGIQADVQWVGTDRLAVHLSPDALDSLVEGNISDEALEAEREAGHEIGYEEGREYGYTEASDEWGERLAVLRDAWRSGMDHDIVEALTNLAADLHWGGSAGAEDLRSRH